MAAELQTTPGGLAVFERTRFRDVDFRRAVFEFLRVSGCDFERCDFRGIVLDRRYGALFLGSPRNTFVDCRFEGADLRQVRPGRARFERCSFAGADLDGWVSGAAEFVDCVFAGRTVGAKFYGRPWGEDAEGEARAANEFSGNDFRESDLVDVSFLMGVDIAAQRWPSATEYVRLDRIQQRLTRAHAEILNWEDFQARRDALAMLRTVSELSVAQKEIFVRRGDSRWRTRRDIEDRVWKLLRRVAP